MAKADISEKAIKSDKFVRFNVNLTKDSYDSLLRLQELSDKPTLAETLRDALKLYLVIQEGREENKDVYLVEKTTKEKEKLVF